jgi:hypothetical protein
MDILYSVGTYASLKLATNVSYWSWIKETDCKENQWTFQKK